MRAVFHAAAASRGEGRMMAAHLTKCADTCHLVLFFKKALRLQGWFGEGLWRKLKRVNVERLAKQKQANTATGINSKRCDTRNLRTQRLRQMDHLENEGSLNFRVKL